MSRWQDAIAGLTLSVVLAASASAQNDARYVVTDQFVDVTDGTTMFYLVREHYPLRKNNWLEVAHDLAIANPEAFRNGDPGALIIGRRIFLIDYGEGIESAPPPAPSAADSAPASAPVTPAADPTPVPAGQDTPTVATVAPQPVSAPTATAPAVAIGQVTRLGGSASAARTGTALRSLRQGDNVHLGDSLMTEDDTRLTLLMADGAIVHLRPASRIVFEKYGAAVRPLKGSVMTLAEGGMRVITPTEKGTNVTVINTAVATLSIEHADIALRLCSDGECRVEDLSVPIADGLYCEVARGTLSVSNNTGAVTASRGDVLRVRDADAGPQAAPEALGAAYTPLELTELDLRGDEPLGFFSWFRQRFF